ncbi:LysM peptidoglycan-binding domain-containing protein, partial [Staphylococcus aureus]
MKKLAFAITATSGAAAFLTHHDAQASTQHTVQSGESLNIIASRYGVSVDQLMAANNLRGYLIMPNQTLQIPNGGSGGTTPTATTGSNGNASSFNHQNL